MRSRSKLIFLGMLLSAVGACGRVQDLYIIDAATTGADRTEEDIKGSKPAPPLNLDTFAFREDLIPHVKYDSELEKTMPVANTGNIRTAYYLATKSDEQDSKIYRNRLQDVIINRSIDICKYHKGAILANKSVFDFGTGLLATILGTASGAVGGETAAKILGTASGAVSATGLALDANFYQNLFATAIIREIERSRQEFFENKIVPRRTGSTTEYTIDQAIRDANEYHVKCSFFQGVVALVKETKDEPMTRDEVLEEIARLNQEMESLESKFAPDAPDGRVKQDAEFLWNVFSTRKKQLATLLVDARTPGRIATKKNGEDARAEFKDPLPDNWETFVPEKDEVAALLKVFHTRSGELRILDNELSADKFKDPATFRVLRGYIEEVQALLGLTGAQVDGLIWDATRSKIPDAGKKLTESVITNLFDGSLKTGASKPSTPSVFETLLLKSKAGQTSLKSIQKKLDTPETGDLDDATRDKINDRRKKFGLPQTGYLTRLLARMIEAAKSSKEVNDKTIKNDSSATKATPAAPVEEVQTDTLGSGPPVLSMGPCPTTDEISNEGELANKGKSLLDEMKGVGGYVAVFRHADKGGPTQYAGSIECQEPKNGLTGPGRNQAKAIGAAFTRLGIPVDAVKASKYCRTIETASLAFSKVVPLDSLLPINEGKLAQVISDHLKDATSQKKNVILVTHSNNLDTLHPKMKLACGEAAIFKNRAGKSSCEARILPDEWPQLGKENVVPVDELRMWGRDCWGDRRPIE